MSLLASARSLTATKSAGRRWRSLGGVGFALGVYALTRLFVVVVVIITGRHQIAIPLGLPSYHSFVPTGAAPGYWTIMNNWDGQWYRAIATHGYPSALPLDTAGRVTTNAWAFLPLYPLLVGGLTWVTGLSFATAGPALSVVVGGVAVVVIFRLVQDALDTKAASMVVVLICTSMTAPVLQAAYSESLALLFLCSSLLLLRRRRYAWTALAIVSLALTRNVALAMAPVILLHGAVRWRARADDEFTKVDQLKVGGLAALSVAATGLWPAIAGAVTGDASAYTRTIAAWGGELRVLIAWPRTFFNGGGLGGLLLFFLLLSLLFGLLARRAARRWGPELWGWAVSYPVYLILVTAVDVSAPRHWLLAFPLALLAVDFVRWMGSPVVRTCVLGFVACGGLALQWIWIANFLVVTDPARPIFP